MVYINYRKFSVNRGLNPLKKLLVACLKIRTYFIPGLRKDMRRSINFCCRQSFLILDLHILWGDWGLRPYKLLRSILGKIALYWNISLWELSLRSLNTSRYRPRLKLSEWTVLFESDPEMWSSQVGFYFISHSTSNLCRVSFVVVFLLMDSSKIVFSLFTLFGCFCESEMMAF